MQKQVFLAGVSLKKDIPISGSRAILAWIVCLYIILQAIVGNTNAADVSGQQAGVWRQADSPIRLIGTVEVAIGAALAIEPGTVILGSSTYISIIVRGTLNASGTESQPIVFTSTAGSGGNQWGAIVFDPGSTGVVQHAECRYGGGANVAGMIQIDDAQITVQNVKFLSSGEDGVHVSNIEDPQRVVIRQCAFEGNASDGIQCNTASPTIAGCSFSGNGAAAIRLTGTSSPDFNGDLTAPTDGIHLAAATLEASAHWEYAGIPYILDGTIVAPANTSLTIEAGVVIKGSSRYNGIYIGGHLSILGSAAQPVRLTSLRDDTIAGDTNGDSTNSVPAGNDWGAIVFDPGSTGVVQHAECRYGGGANVAGMIQINDAQVTVQNVRFLSSGEDGMHVSNIEDPQRVVIRQCAFEGNASDGIQCNTASPTIAGCSFSGNGAAAIRLTGTSSPDFNGDLTAPTDGIHLAAATLEASAHWEYAGIPYILDGTIVAPANTSLTIEAGVVIKGSSRYNGIYIGGHLSILGSAAQPVRLTSLRDDTIAGDTNGDSTNSVPAGNDWGAIVFDPGSTGVVQHAECRYGGGANVAGMTQINDAQVTVQNVRFLSSGGDGIHVSNIDDPRRVVIRRCAFVGNAGDGIQCNTASPTVQQSYFAGNGGSGIWLTGTSFPDFQGDLTADREGIGIADVTLTRSGTYNYAGIPYILAGSIVIPAGTQLNLEPGVIVKGNSYYRNIIVDGRFEALGTAERPIYLTSYNDDLGGDTNQDGQDKEPAQPSGGDWGGVRFRSGSTGALAYVHLRYGGGASKGLLEIDQAQVTLDQSHLTDSSEDGIWYGDYLLAGNPPAIHQCNIAGNRAYGIRNAGSKQVDATQVWWGNATGPYHKTLNPAGQGDAVTDQVLFSPFLTGPVGAPAGVQIAQQPQSQVAAKGQTVTLTVQTSGIWPIAYQWRQNGMLIAEATGATLVLDNVQAADAGAYTVVVSNASGSMTSAPATLTVTADNQPPTVSLTSPASNAAFTAPATIALEASAADSGGTISKVEFFSGANKLGEDTSTPYSFTWQKVAAGTYSLTARATDNQGAATTSGPVSVAVASAELAPTINREPSDQGVEEGGAVIFSVSVHGSEPLKYQWSRDGTPLPEATAAVLELLNVSTNQAGLYTVAVSNAAGSAASLPARLVVTARPADLPRLAIGWSEGGLKLDCWLRNQQGFFSIFQADRVAGLASSSNVLISAPIPTTRRSSHLITDWVPSTAPARFFQVREERGFTNFETKPYFSQTVAPSAQPQTIQCGQGVTIQIPGGVLSSPQPLTVAKLMPNPLLPRPAGMAIGSIFEISLGGQQTFATPLTIEIPYAPELLNPELPLSAAVTAAFWHPVENVWSVVAAVADPQRRVLTVKTRHLSLWASAYTFHGYQVLTDPQEQIMVVFHPANQGVISGGLQEPRTEFNGTDFARKAFEFATNALALYRSAGFTEAALPAWIFIDPAQKEGMWSGKTGNLYLPATYKTTADFRGDVGHELFHHVQNSYYNVYAAEFGSGKWWHEACAEYAGYRLAGGSLPPLQDNYLLDFFLLEPLTTVDGSHEYGAANFLDYVFTSAGILVAFEGQFKELISSSLTETVIDRLDAYIERRTSSKYLLRTLYLSFAYQFYLNKSGLKPYLDIWRMPKGVNEKPGAELLIPAPKYKHTFELKSGYTAKILTMRVSAVTEQEVCRLRVIYAEGPGDDSGIVRMFINAHEPRFADAAAIDAAGWTLGAPGTSGATNVVEVKQDDYLTIIACNTYSRDRSVTVAIEEEAPPAIDAQLTIWPRDIIFPDFGPLRITATVNGLADKAVIWSLDPENCETGGLLNIIDATTVEYLPAQAGYGVIHVMSRFDPQLWTELRVVFQLAIKTSKSYVKEGGIDYAIFKVDSVAGGIGNLKYTWFVGGKGTAGSNTFKLDYWGAGQVVLEVEDDQGHTGVAYP